MKVALVHDDFMQWGGAERLVLDLGQLFPEAPIYTIYYNEKVLPAVFPKERLRSSFLQKIKFIYRPLFFLHPLIFESFDFSAYDLVITSTTRFAKSIITKPGTIHICYCNTPPRFLWSFSDYFESKDINWVFKNILKVLMAPLISYLRIQDQAAAQRVDYFIANSNNIANRITKYYGRESKVIYPFVELDRFDDEKVQETKQIGQPYYLIVSRLSGHKRIDIAIDAFNKNGLCLKIIGIGPEAGKYQKMAKKNIEFLGRLSDQEVVHYLKNCEAFIYPQEEDFGITALEAQACGRPVIAFAKGGALETVVEGKTGLFFQEQTSDSLSRAIGDFESLGQATLDEWRTNCLKQARNSSQGIFNQKISEFVLQALKG